MTVSIRPASLMIAAAVVVMVTAANAQGVNAPGAAPDPKAFLAGDTKDCPGCDLSNAKLKRRDLTGANLSGANLSGAILHRAILRNADLSHANLSDANLNKTDLTLAKFVCA